MEELIKSLLQDMRRVRAIDNKDDDNSIYHMPKKIWNKFFLIAQINDVHKKIDRKLEVKKAIHMLINHVCALCANEDEITTNGDFFKADFCDMCGSWQMLAKVRG